MIINYITHILLGAHTYMTIITIKPLVTRSIQAHLVHITMNSVLYTLLQIRLQVVMLTGGLPQIMDTQELLLMVTQEAIMQMDPFPDVLMNYYRTLERR
jgi:hypothetical protein